ncbi:MAG: hypothetical protein ACLSGA_12375 [Ruminococcus sp.]
MEQLIYYDEHRRNPVLSTHELSLPHGNAGKVSYVLEGNINYTGAVITAQDDMELIQSPAETEALCRKAEEMTVCILFRRLQAGAPYWNSEAKGALTGITRTTRKADGACRVECIAYQIADVVNAMSQDAKTEIQVACGRRTDQKSVSDAVSE